MRRRLAPLLAVPAVALAACSSGGDEGTATAADTLTRDQKDSLISTLPVPGAGVVGRARGAAADARARAEALDSIGG